MLAVLRLQAPSLESPVMASGFGDKVLSWALISKPPGPGPGGDGKSGDFILCLRFPIPV